MHGAEGYYVHNILIPPGPVYDNATLYNCSKLGAKNDDNYNSRCLSGLKRRRLPYEFSENQGCVF